MVHKQGRVPAVCPALCCALSGLYDFNPPKPLPSKHHQHYYLPGKLQFKESLRKVKKLAQGHGQSQDLNPNPADAKVHGFPHIKESLVLLHRGEGAEDTQCW